MSKRKALVSDLIRKDVFAVMAGDHVSPEQRMTLWLGGPRPSLSLDLIIQRLEDVQPNFEHGDALKRLQASWKQVCLGRMGCVGEKKGVGVVEGTCMCRLCSYAIIFV